MAVTIGGCDDTFKDPDVINKKSFICSKVKGQVIRCNGSNPNRETSRVVKQSEVKTKKAQAKVHKE